MVSSGRLQGNTVDGGDYSVLEWSSTQNVGGNYSTVSWTAGWHFGSTYCRGLRNGAATLNGTTVYYNHNSGDAVHAYNSSHRHNGTDLWVASGAINIGHASDGNQTLSTYVDMTGYSGRRSEGWVVWNLPAIPRMPTAPYQVTFSNIRQTTVDIAFVDGYSALPIDARELAYGPTPSYPPYSLYTDGSETITDLLPGGTYYFWARTHNSTGWGPWSEVSSVRTVGGAKIRVGTEIKPAVVYVKDGGIWKPTKPYVKYAGEWKEMA